MAELATEDCMHKLYSDLFGEKSTVVTDITHDVVNGCIPIPEDETPNDNNLENSTIKNHEEHETCMKAGFIHFLSIGEIESYFKDQENIFIRDVFPNNEYNGLPHTCSNISLSSVFDQAGFNPFN